MGMTCGDRSCPSGQLCCGPNTETPMCYSPGSGDHCCLPSAEEVSGFPVVCTAAQSCCGNGTAMSPQCFFKHNETCCTAWNSYGRICGLGSSCCPFWGPPIDFHCCNASASCCDLGGGMVDHAGVCCDAKSAQCCLSSYSTCCALDEVCCCEDEGSAFCCPQGKKCGSYE